ncbi:hypothetical protein [Sporolactobacillus terrae]|uniref:hypothetical protein n=1 Tax=Sporolactobacillus terrae TaxID=269673 RepID=UPI000490479B|nr:hypothetical protein [Sporolactobacillus terrae]
MIDFSNVQLPINAIEVLKTGLGLFGLLAAIVLLDLAFVFHKEILWTIRTAINWHKTGKEYNRTYAKKGDPWNHWRTVKRTYQSGKYYNWGKW